MKDLVLVGLTLGLGVGLFGRQGFEGCYDLELGPWQPVEATGVVHPAPPPHEAPDSLFYSVPLRVQFLGDTARFVGGRAFAMVVPQGGLPTLHNQSYWWIEGDTLNLHWASGGLVGVHGDVPIRSDPLEGWVQTFSDVEGLRQYRARLTAEAVACSAPVPGGPFVVDSLVRAVEFQDGGRIVLGEPFRLEAGRLRPRSSGAYDVEGQPGGLFDSMDSVRVRFVPGTDTVAAIQLRMSGHKDLSPVLDRLIATIGAPDPSDAPVVGPSWWRRITRVSVWESRGSRGHRIWIGDQRLSWR